MTSKSNEIRLQNRKNNQIVSKVDKIDFSNRGFCFDKTDHVIFCSPTDHGVVNNFGRQGSRFAPQSICNSLLKFNIHNSIIKVFIENSKSFSEYGDDFNLYQNEEIKNILQIWDLNPINFYHLGGGHDLIYPLVKSLYEYLITNNFNYNKKKIEKIKIINLDAHLDTRVDSINHSGTPFRQLSNELKEKLEIVQIGIDHFANSKENFDLHTSNMKIVMMNEVNKTFSQKSFNEVFNIKNNDYVILSLDADAIESSSMPAVSAVNPKGLSKEFIFNILHWFKSIKAPKTFGIYEYNPIFDDLSNRSSKLLASFIYELMC